MKVVWMRLNSPITNLPSVKIFFLKTVLGKYEAEYYLRQVAMDISLVGEPYWLHEAYFKRPEAYWTRSSSAFQYFLLIDHMKS